MFGISLPSVLTLTLLLALVAGEDKANTHDVNQAVNFLATQLTNFYFTSVEPSNWYKPLRILGVKVTPFNQGRPDSFRIITVSVVLEAVNPFASPSQTHPPKVLTCTKARIKEQKNMFNVLAAPCDAAYDI